MIIYTQKTFAIVKQYQPTWYTKESETTPSITTSLAGRRGCRARRGRRRRWFHQRSQRPTTTVTGQVAITTGRPTDRRATVALVDRPRSKPPAHCP